ncbi:hypothetical protein O9G_004611, partial [Rozella allomycis CSF55]
SKSDSKKFKKLNEKDLFILKKLFFILLEFSKLDCMIDPEQEYIEMDNPKPSFLDYLKSHENNCNSRYKLVSVCFDYSIDFVDSIEFDFENSILQFQATSNKVYQQF